VDQKIIQSLNGTARPEEDAEVMRWRAESMENESRYQEFAGIWGATSPPEEMNGIRVPDAARIIAIANRRTGRARAAEAFGGTLVRAAAMAGIFLGGIAAGRLFLAGPDPLAALEISTGPNELTSARLSDGSTVRLAPNSSLRMEQDGSGRQVRLDGRAFFSVVEDPLAPFVVRTEAGDATVLGTRFQIDATPDNLHVLVVEGRVRMATGSGSVEIGVGQSGRASRGNAPVLEDVGQIQPALAWMAGVLVFNGTPVRQVAAEIEQRYGVRFQIPDGPVGDRSVSATFTTEDLPTVVSIVCRVVDLQCTLEGSEVTVVD
jgi:transmembrane sensor